MNFLENVLGITQKSIDSKKASAALTTLASLVALGTFMVIEVVVLSVPEGEVEEDDKNS